MMIVHYIDAPTRKLFAKRLGRKYQLLFEILLNTGLRTSELVSLREGDVSLEGEFILVQTDEKSQRRILLNESAKASLYLWMQQYKGQHLLFEMDTKSIAERFRRASATLGIHITPRSCRHTYISSIYRVTQNISTTQRAAGHRSVRSTLQYCHSTEDDLKIAVGKI